MKKQADGLQFSREDLWHDGMGAPTPKDRPTQPIDQVTKEAKSAAQLLRESKDESDLRFNRSATIRKQTPDLHTEKGRLPKVAMSRLEEDPLVQYLKHAAQDTFDLPGGSVLPTNEGALPLGHHVPKLVAENPNPTDSLEKAVVENKRYLEELFDSRDFRNKYTDKEHEV